MSHLVTEKCKVLLIQLIISQIVTSVVFHSTYQYLQVLIPVEKVLRSSHASPFLSLAQHSSHHSTTRET